MLCRVSITERLCEDLLTSHQHHVDSHQHSVLSLKMCLSFVCVDYVDECQHGVGVLREGPHTQYASAWAPLGFSLMC